MSWFDKAAEAAERDVANSPEVQAVAERFARRRIAAEEARAKKAARHAGRVARAAAAQELRDLEKEWRAEVREMERGERRRERVAEHVDAFLSIRDDSERARALAREALRDHRADGARYEALFSPRLIEELRRGLRDELKELSTDREERVSNADASPSWIKEVDSRILTIRRIWRSTFRKAEE